MFGLFPGSIPGLHQLFSFYSKSSSRISRLVWSRVQGQDNVPFSVPPARPGLGNTQAFHPSAIGIRRATNVIHWYLTLQQLDQAEANCTA
jgi:hypothetical protein